ncbi:hypothetical protein BDB01DRAFT_431635 [Pilobolus umbonatus]|nr:hypothetical protein BDB01DRAFT_431635 [Pilobolus umbonatus]
MSDKKTTPSLASLSKTRQPGKLNSLSQLKQKTAQSSLQSLASKATKPELSLQNLAKRTTLTTSPKSNSLAHLANRASTPQKTVKSEINTPSIKKESIQQQPPQPKVEKKATKPLEDTISDQTYNPLYAKPSVAAQFLFMQLDKPPHTHFSTKSTQPIHSTLYESIRKSSPIHIFEFNTPSPDDIVFNAQSKRSNKTMN